MCLYICTCSGVFRNLKGGGCPGVHFRCTFSKVFKIWHKHIFTLNIGTTIFSPPKWGQVQAQPPLLKCTPVYVFAKDNHNNIQWHYVVYLVICIRSISYSICANVPFRWAGGHGKDFLITTGCD